MAGILLIPIVIVYTYGQYIPPPLSNFNVSKTPDPAKVIGTVAHDPWPQYFASNTVTETLHSCPGSSLSVPFPLAYVQRVRLQSLSLTNYLCGNRYIYRECDHPGTLNVEVWYFHIFSLTCRRGAIVTDGSGQPCLDSRATCERTCVAPLNNIFSTEFWGTTLTGTTYNALTPLRHWIATKSPEGRWFYSTGVPYTGFLANSIYMTFSWLRAINYETIFLFRARESTGGTLIVDHYFRISQDNCTTPVALRTWPKPACVDNCCSATWQGLGRCVEPGPSIDTALKIDECYETDSLTTKMYNLPCTRMPFDVFFRVSRNLINLVSVTATGIVTYHVDYKGVVTVDRRGLHIPAINDMSGVYEIACNTDFVRYSVYIACPIYTPVRNPAGHVKLNSSVQPIQVGTALKYLAYYDDNYSPVPKIESENKIRPIHDHTGAYNRLSNGMVKVFTTNAYYNVYSDGTVKLRDTYTLNGFYGRPVAATYNTELHDVNAFGNLRPVTLDGNVYVTHSNGYMAIATINKYIYTMANGCIYMKCVTDTLGQLITTNVNGINYLRPETQTQPYTDQYLFPVTIGDYVQVRNISNGLANSYRVPKIVTFNDLIKIVTYNNNTYKVDLTDYVVPDTGGWLTQYPIVNANSYIKPITYPLGGIVMVNGNIVPVRTYRLVFTNQFNFRPVTVDGGTYITQMEHFYLAPTIKMLTQLVTLSDGWAKPANTINTNGQGYFSPMTESALHTDVNGYVIPYTNANGHIVTDSEGAVSPMINPKEISYITNALGYIKIRTDANSNLVTVNNNFVPVTRSVFITNADGYLQVDRSQAIVYHSSQRQYVSVKTLPRVEKVLDINIFGYVKAQVQNSQLVTMRNDSFVVFNRYPVFVTDSAMNIIGELYRSQYINVSEFVKPLTRNKGPVHPYLSDNMAVPSLQNGAIVTSATNYIAVVTTSKLTLQRNGTTEGILAEKTTDNHFITYQDYVKPIIAQEPWVYVTDQNKFFLTVNNAIEDEFAQVVTRAKYITNNRGHLKVQTDANGIIFSSGNVFAAYRRIRKSYPISLPDGSFRPLTHAGTVTLNVHGNPYYTYEYNFITNAEQAIRMYTENGMVVTFGDHARPVTKRVKHFRFVTNEMGNVMPLTLIDRTIQKAGTVFLMRTEVAVQTDNLKGVYIASTRGDGTVVPVLLTQHANLITDINGMLKPYTNKHNMPVTDGDGYVLGYRYFTHSRGGHLIRINAINKTIMNANFITYANGLPVTNSNGDYVLHYGYVFDALGRPVWITTYDRIRVPEGTLLFDNNNILITDRNGAPYRVVTPSNVVTDISQRIVGIKDNVLGFIQGIIVTNNNGDLRLIKNYANNVIVIRNGTTYQVGQYIYDERNNYIALDARNIPLQYTQQPVTVTDVSNNVYLYTLNASQIIMVSPNGYLHLLQNYEVTDSDGHSYVVKLNTNNDVEILHYNQSYFHIVKLQNNTYVTDNIGKQYIIRSYTPVSLITDMNNVPLQWDRDRFFGEDINGNKIVLYHDATGYTPLTDETNTFMHFVVADTNTYVTDSANNYILALTHPNGAFNKLVVDDTGSQLYAQVDNRSRIISVANKYNRTIDVLTRDGLLIYSDGNIIYSIFYNGHDYIKDSGNRFIHYVMTNSTISLLRDIHGNFIYGVATPQGKPYLDGNGNLLRIITDSNGTAIDIKDSNNRSVIYTLLANDQIHILTDPDNNYYTYVTSPEITVYDSRNQPVHFIIDAAQVPPIQLYQDDNGNPLTYTLGNNNRVIEVLNKDGNRVLYSINKDGYVELVMSNNKPLHHVIINGSVVNITDGVETYVFAKKADNSVHLVTDNHKGYMTYKQIGQPPLQRIIDSQGHYVHSQVIDGVYMPYYVAPLGYLYYVTQGQSSRVTHITDSADYFYMFDNDREPTLVSNRDGVIRYITDAYNGKVSAVYNGQGNRVPFITNSDGLLYNEIYVHTIPKPRQLKENGKVIGVVDYLNRPIWDPLKVDTNGNIVTNAKGQILGRDGNVYVHKDFTFVRPRTPKPLRDFDGNLYTNSDRNIAIDTRIDYDPVYITDEIGYYKVITDHNGIIFPENPIYIVDTQKAVIVDSSNKRVVGDMITVTHEDYIYCITQASSKNVITNSEGYAVPLTYVNIITDDKGNVVYKDDKPVTHQHTPPTHHNIQTSNLAMIYVNSIVTSEFVNTMNEPEQLVYPMYLLQTQYIVAISITIALVGAAITGVIVYKVTTSITHRSYTYTRL